MRLTLHPEAGPIHSDVPELRGGSGSHIDNCDFAGPNYFGDHNLFRRSSIGRYSAFGSRCQVIDATIGGFCSFGDNIIVNAGTHPQAWLSTHLFQCNARAWQWSRDYVSAGVSTRNTTWRNSASVGNDVWVCNNVVIATGVTIGDGAIIAANSAVTSDVPPYALAGGSPAVIKKYRFDESTIRRLLATRWWDRPMSELARLPFDDIGACLKILELSSDSRETAAAPRPGR
jgi:acetyltransferase-like isoleucine patch superfamily enzyme